MKNTKSNNNLLILLFAGVLMGALDIAIIGPALPAIRNEYLIDLRAGSWIFNSYLLLYLLSAPLMAKLSDIYGRRIIYIFDILLFAFGSIIITVSNTYPILLIGRAIQGLGAGGIFPVASAVIGDTIPKEKQGMALGLIGSVFGLAFILGPIIGGFLLMYNWRWIFAINIPIAILIIAFSFLIPKEAKQESRKFDLLGLIVLTIILSSFSYSLSSIDSNQFMSSILSLEVLPFFLISIVLIPAFWEIESRTVNPIINPKIIKQKQLAIAYLIAFGAGVCEAVAMYAPGLAKHNFNISDSKASFMLLPMVFAMFIAAPFSGFLIDKKGPRFTLIVGTSTVTISLIILTFFSNQLWGFYLGGALLGFGLSFLLGAPLRYIINNDLDKSYRAVGQSVVSISTTMGQIISTALLGGIITSYGSQYFAYQAALGVLAFVALLTFIISGQLKK